MPVLGDDRTGGGQRLVAAALVAALAIAAALALGGPPGSPGAAETASASAGPTAKAAGKRKAAIRRAHRLVARGKIKRARKVLRRVKRHGRYTGKRRSRRDRRGKIPARAKGNRKCGVASGSTEVGDRIFDETLFEVSVSQEVCWKDGKLTRVGALRVDDNVTGWGSAWNWSYEGVTYTDNDFSNGHRRHTSVKRVRFGVCTPWPAGCLFPDDYDFAVAIVTRGNGTFGYGDSE